MWRDNIISGIWGFLAAILLFIVPDVYLTCVGITSYKRSLLCCLSAMLGTLIGGTIMYFWARYNFYQVNSLLILLPGISQELVRQVQDALVRHGLVEMLWGPIRWIPYKIYAGLSGAASLNYLGFILLSIPFHLLRYFVFASIGAFLNRTFFRWFFPVIKYSLVVIGWGIFYFFYFQKMGW